MRQSLLLSSLAVLLADSAASAATLYVSPTGDAASDCATRAAPCSLATAASSAAAGDTVVLMDGIYQEPLYVANSGTSSAWITFEADECATPIIEGEGAGPNDDIQTTGVGSEEAEYVRFRGLVSRGWNIGFGNGWAGGTDSDEVSNGHWEIDSCLAYSNGRTGFTFFSAEGFHLSNSISAHNGSSILHSWSSGVSLFEATGTNVIERTVSFENTEAEKRNDGSGFIVDEESNNATFVNNIAFGNSGSCLRLTRSSGTRFINNTCYHNSQFGSQATGPSNPGEIYFTGGDSTQEGVTFMNNVLVGTGQSPAGSEPVINKPSSGWTNNVETTGSVTFFMDATGTNPNFVPSSGATQLVGAGSGANGAPTNDIGFDPKCIVKRTPVMVGAVARESWWQYDVDIDYIKSIGGVGKCFNPATRSGNPDIGAYKAGNVTTVAPGSCVPPPTGGTTGTGGTDTGGGAGTTSTGGVGGMGGAATGGRTGTAGSGTGGTGAGGAVTGGRTGAGGAVTGGVGAGGTGGAGDTSTGGMGGATATGTGGMGGTGATGTGTGGTAPGVGGAANTGGTPGTAAASGGGTGIATTGTGGAGVGGGSNPGQDSSTSAGDDGGCGCRAAGTHDHRGWLAALGVLGVGLLARRRRAGGGGAIR
ncbi:MAG: right-handed parallel beta-helix repeat-containing protein [Polyangiaceae bacterium]|nr:right-handed parallel beta-helix repeat-containing protein [Polyangiaceae bacterium]